MSPPSGWRALLEPLLCADPAIDDLAVAQDFVTMHGGLPRQIHPTLPVFFPAVSLSAPALLASFTDGADIRVPAYACAEHARGEIARLLRRLGRGADALTVDALEPIRSRPTALAAATWVTPDWVKSLRSLTHSAALGTFRQLCSALVGSTPSARLAEGLGRRMLRVQQRLDQALGRSPDEGLDRAFFEMVRACLDDRPDRRAG